MTHGHACPKNSVAPCIERAQAPISSIKPRLAVSDGPFSFTITLVRGRNGNDRNGRHYNITVVAVDAVGNRTTAKPLLVNVHDQSK